MTSISSNNHGLFTLGEDAAAMDEIQNVGVMDQYLTQASDVTFWRYRYPRYTNFALIPSAQQLEPQPTFGGTSTITFNPTGDLLYYTYVVIDLPGIHAEYCTDNSCGRGSTDYNQFPTSSNRGIKAAESRAFRNVSRRYGDESTEIGRGEWALRNNGQLYSPGCQTDCSSTASLCDGKPYVHWANAIGQLLIKTATLAISNNVTAQINSDFLYVWEELSGKAGKRLTEMIGKRRTRAELIEDASRNQRLYVPLSFYYTMASGNSIAICAIRRGSVQIQIEFESLSNCIIVSDRGLTVINNNTNRPISNGDLKAWIDAMYVMVDLNERNQFAMGNFEQLMSQVQTLRVIPPRTSPVTIPLSFKHPVMELLFVVRRKRHEDVNNWFNYSGILGQDPVRMAILQWDGRVRVQREGRYFRLVQPFQHHTNIPKGYIYAMSFCLFAEDPQPSGSANFSMFQKIELVLHLQDGLQDEQITILVFARNWNLLWYKANIVGPLFN